MIEANYAFCTSDNVNILGKSWEPKDFYKGLIILIHGFGEHMNRYEHVAKYFTDRGFAFVGMDRRGHGVSDGQRGHFPSLDRELEDLSQYVQEAKKRFPNVPTFLYGHSQGGNFTLNLILRKHPEVDGAIVTSPWIKLATEPPKALVAIGKFLNKIFPTVSTDAGVGTLSRDPEVDKKYKADPLVHGKITFRAANETMNAADWLYGYKEAIKMPLLLMHGTGDTITSHAASQQFYENTKKSIDVKWWNGFYHEIHNEPEKEEVLEYMYNWMMQVV
jgi:alpha-beta hydrolase superfamily lysophospholipase